MGHKKALTFILRMMLILFIAGGYFYISGGILTLGSSWFVYLLLSFIALFLIENYLNSLCFSLLISKLKKCKIHYSEIQHSVLIYRSEIRTTILKGNNTVKIKPTPQNVSCNLILLSNSFIILFETFFFLNILKKKHKPILITFDDNYINELNIRKNRISTFSNISIEKQNLMIDTKRRIKDIDSIEIIDFLTFFSQKYSNYEDIIDRINHS